ncbi:MAG TPA: hypothetical protein VGO59_03030 [Verrucomicrobiae bacterium]|jgi:hypothetical protein
MEIKKWLENMKEPYLDYGAFARHCNKLNEKDPASQAALLEVMDAKFVTHSI